MFQGSIVALVTPMQADGSIDKKAVHELVDWHLAEKTDGFVIVGTTGESPTVSSQEQFELVSAVVKQVAKRVPVIAGTGTNCTQSSLERTLRAKEAGADGCLLITPYCNKPSQQGLYEHYRLIAEKTSLPLVLYNVPGRTACDLLPETIERLATFKNIVAVKEATGKIERADEIKKRCPHVVVLSGDDATALKLMRHGAKGIISVTANVAPRAMHELCQAANKGDFKTAEKINDTLVATHQKLFVEANPIPVKWALHQMKKIPAGIRLPLTWLDAKYHADVQEALQAAHILT